ncbi:MAG: efflux RND transporter periplasmic adaptor subunit [Alphaproteobacteria bacterium]|nr:MAG: efflux RND transporter periplasmic adaptor subunit [Alphaproteobacteria bacterium]
MLQKYFLTISLVRDFPGVHNQTNLRAWVRRHLTVFGVCTGVIVWFASGAIRLGGPNETPIKPVRVKVHAMRAQVIHPIISLRGLTGENRKVSLRADIEGKVRDIIAKTGTRHEKGTKLIRLSLETRAQELAEAESLVLQCEIEYQAAVKLAKKKFRSKTDVARAKSALKTANTKREQARDRIKDMEIFAPFDCVFEESSVEVGASVRPGEILGVVLETNPIKVTAYATEKDLQAIHVGNSVRVGMRDGKKYPGSVTFIASAAEPTTRLFRVEVGVNNADNCVRIGTPVGVYIKGIPQKSYRLSPAHLSFSDAGELGVKILRADNRVYFQKITILSHTHRGAVVTGLPDEVRLITDGHEYAQTGSEVIPVEGE